MAGKSSRNPRVDNFTAHALPERRHVSLREVDGGAARDALRILAHKNAAVEGVGLQGQLPHHVLLQLPHRNIRAPSVPLLPLQVATEHLEHRVVVHPQAVVVVDAWACAKKNLSSIFFPTMARNSVAFLNLC